VDSDVFDRLVSALGRTGSRRGVMQVVAATLGLGGLSRLGRQDVSAKKKKRGGGSPLPLPTTTTTQPPPPANQCPTAFTCPDPFGGPAPVCGKVAGPKGGTCGCYLSTEKTTICVNETDSNGEFLDANTLKPCSSTQECRETVGFHFFCKAVTTSPSGKTCGSTVSRCWPECDAPTVTGALMVRATASRRGRRARHSR
jgi:hypothetical protein